VYGVVVGNNDSAGFARWLNNIGLSESGNGA